VLGINRYYSSNFFPLLPPANRAGQAKALSPPAGGVRIPCPPWQRAAHLGVGLYSSARVVRNLTHRLLYRTDYNRWTHILQL